MQNQHPKTYGLAIHTSSPELGLALMSLEDENDISQPHPSLFLKENIERSQIVNLGRDLSTQLHQSLAQFIEPQTWTDLAWVAVAKGPGSFTGTRIGVVTARTLAQQLNIPLFAISTLAAIAWEKLNLETEIIALQMRAQRGQLFVAIYGKIQEQNRRLVALLPDTVMSPQQWQHTLESWNTPYQLIEVEGGLGQGAMELVKLAYLDWKQGKRPHWSEALPYYGQHPVQD